MAFGKGLRTNILVDFIFFLCMGRLPALPFGEEGSAEGQIEDSFSY